MRKISSLAIIFIILFSSVAPVIAAEASKKGLEEINKEVTVIDMTKESFKSISTADKSLSVQVKDTDISKYTIKADAYSISIKKAESAKETTKTIHEDVVDSWIGFDGTYVGKLHIANDGTVTHSVVDVSQYLVGNYYELPTELSETIYSGYTGIYQVTQTINQSSDTFTLPDADYSVVTVESVGADSYGVIEEGNLSTYPNNITRLYDFLYDGDVTDYSGNNDNLSLTNVEYVNDSGDYVQYYDGNTAKSSFSLLGALTNTSGTISVVVKANSSNNPFDKIIRHYSESSSDSRIYLQSYDSGNKYQWQVGDGSYVKNYAAALGSDYVRYSIVFDNGTAITYIDCEIVGSGSYSGITTLGTTYVGSTGTGQYWNGFMKQLVVSDSAYGISEITKLCTGINGTSLTTPNNTHHAFTDGTLTLTNATGGTYSIQSSDESVGEVESTVTAYFTEDVTLISESESDGIVTISINQTSQHDSTDGWIEYTPIHILFSPSLDSTNSNATLSYTGGVLNISTGPLTAGDNNFYNITGTLTSLLLTGHSPTGSRTVTLVDTNETFRASSNIASTDWTWYLDGNAVYTEDDTATTSYTVSNSSSDTYNLTVIGTAGASSISHTWNWIVVQTEWGEHSSESLDMWEFISSIVAVFLIAFTGISVINTARGGNIKILMSVALLDVFYVVLFIIVPKMVYTLENI
jgi:hypothetical protein